MKYFLKKFLSLFIPFEEGDPPPGDPPPGDPPPGDPPPKAPPPPGDPNGRPDWCPEKFWDQDMKAPRTQVALEAFGELETKLRGNKETLAEELKAEAIAGLPEQYEFTMPDDLKIPDGMEFDLTAEDPMVDWFFGFARENALSQDVVNAAIAKYVQIEMDGMPDMDAEIKLLGDHGQDRMVRVTNWLDQSLSPEEAESLHPLLTSATQVAALEKLMKKAGPGGFDGDPAAAPLTLEELKSMQADPRYHRDHDPAFIKKIEEGYKRLYNTK